MSDDDARRVPWHRFVQIAATGMNPSTVVALDEAGAVWVYVWRLRQWARLSPERTDGLAELADR